MTNRQIPIEPRDRDEVLVGKDARGLHEVAPDVAYKRLFLVNVVYIGRPGGTGDWVLVDAGVLGSSRFIVEGARERFGDRPPACIVLTHGHFDHVGAISELATAWDVPIYAHMLEHPYLDGTRPYPRPDPSVGGGMMSMLSRFYPRGPIDIERWLKPLPVDNTVPNLPGWSWIHTPGHTEGHISLWRESDRLVVAGDAFITTRQESAYAVTVQEPEIHGPPMYYTPDWEKAKESVRALSALEPETCVTGHGQAMKGEIMRMGLRELADRFDEVAVPEQGRYVR